MMIRIVVVLFVSSAFDVMTVVVIIGRLNDLRCDTSMTKMIVDRMRLRKRSGRVEEEESRRTTNERSVAAQRSDDEV